MVRITVIADFKKEKKKPEVTFMGYYWMIPVEKSTDEDYIPALAVVFTTDGELLVDLPTLPVSRVKATRDSDDSRVLNFTEHDFKIRLLEYIPCPLGYPNQLYSDHLEIGEAES